MELIQIIFSILTVAFITTFILLAITYISYRIKEKQRSDSLSENFNSLQPILINQVNQNSKINSVNYSDSIESRKRFEILNNLNSSNNKKFEMMRFTIWNN